MASEAGLFEAEYEREIERLLRRRFGLLLGVTMLMRGVAVCGLLLGWLAPEGSDLAQGVNDAVSPTLRIIMLASSGVTFALCGWFMWWVRPTLHTRPQLLRAASLFVLLSGVNGVAMYLANGLMAESSSVSGFTEMAARYLFACLFLPWTIRESLRPMWPLLALYTLSQVLFAVIGSHADPAVQVEATELSPVAERWLAASAACLFAPLALVPGMAVCWWRTRRLRRRFRSRMIDRGFRSMRHELAQARAVLASLFPPAARLPGAELRFAHLPADEVGGDYLHSGIDGRGRLRLVLLDVSGHGLASALTVARLSGEIERIVAEDPCIEPGRLLGQLNRYCLLTLTRQGIHATGIVLQLDADRGEARYASAGHPPMLCRRGDGQIEAFDSTTTLLGALEEPMFECHDLGIALRPGDTLLLYTDGLTEARDGRERMFGHDRLCGSFARDQPPADWSAHFVQLIDDWRDRLAEDDLLVAEVRWNGPARPASAPQFRAAEAVA